LILILRRLDFDQFTLMGPEPTNNICNNDQFIVSGGTPVPPICGNNVGNHCTTPAQSHPRSKPSIFSVRGRRERRLQPRHPLRRDQRPQLPPQLENPDLANPLQLDLSRYTPKPTLAQQ
jgi:hypothetical protein